jgi:hypothetical protein
MKPKEPLVYKDNPVVSHKPIGITTTVWTWRKTSVSERQLVRIEIIDGVVTEITAHEEDLARIVMAKLVLKIEENPLV